MPRELTVTICKLGDVLLCRRVTDIFAEWVDGHSVFIQSSHRQKWIEQLSDCEGEWCEENGRWYACLTTCQHMDELRPYKLKSGQKRHLRQITVTTEPSDE